MSSSFAVLRKQSLLGDALSHAALPGICLGFMVTGVREMGSILLGALSFKYAADFLSVRASCILYLFFADILVGSAWMRYEEPLRLLMVVPVYIGIALALYFAYAPYRVRDFFAWAFAREARGKRLAMVAAGYGLLLSGVAFTF